MHAAAVVPKLVSAALSVCLRNIPLRRGLINSNQGDSMLTSTLPVRDVAEFATDVRESLTKPGQRELPSKYLYDEVGSALFETICVLPEYGLTRADARLLEKYAAKIVGRLPSPIQVAELGSGSGKKTRWILEALSRRERSLYYTIEISPSAREACGKDPGRIELGSLVGHQKPYLAGF